MKIEYLEQDYHQKLDSCFIFYNGLVYWCRTAEDSILHLYSPDRVNGDPALIVDSDDPLLDIRSPPLGYANYGLRAVFLERLPLRQVKQGCSPRNMAAFKVLGKGGNIIFNRSDPGDFVFGKYSYFRTTYPKLLEAAITAFSENTSIAISRNLALVRVNDMLKVVFKKIEIGIYNPETNVLSIPPGWFASNLSGLVGSDIGWRVE